MLNSARFVELGMRTTGLARTRGGRQGAKREVGRKGVKDGKGGKQEVEGGREGKREGGMKGRRVHETRECRHPAPPSRPLLCTASQASHASLGEVLPPPPLPRRRHPTPPASQSPGPFSRLTSHTKRPWRLLHTTPVCPHAPRSGKYLTLPPPPRPPWREGTFEAELRLMDWKQVTCSVHSHCSLSSA